MFINVAEELKKAREKGYALGAFNANDLEAVKAVCSAAKKTNKPIIIQTTPSAIDYAGLSQIFDIIKNEIEDSGISAAIHLDHAKDFETVQKCIEVGYRSVMIDGSSLSFEENVALTKQVVDFAKTKNVSVEGEIGALGHSEGGNDNVNGSLSTPEQTKKFVELTGIDCVAVSVGNEHGAPEGEKLNMDLLKEISEVIDIPLVLHGASGLSEDDIKQAISLGVSKINIDTQIRKAFIKGMKNINQDENDYRDVLKSSMENIEEVVEEKIKLFSDDK